MADIKTMVEKAKHMAYLVPSYVDHRLLVDAIDTLAEAHQAEVARLTRENEGLAKDAARYRWLRENACDQSDGYDGPELAMMTHGPGWAAEIDAAIDAALAGASGTQEGERHVDA